MKIGIIGLGFMGATHYKAFSAIEGATVTAVSSNSPKALEGDLTEVGGNLGHAAERYDFSQIKKYRDWHELIADPSVEAVDICLPTNLHLPVALAALEAGKHVHCEKPMALSAEECDRMTEGARAAGRVLMVGQVLRFWPEYEELERFVRSGEYGGIRTATFVRRCGVPDWSKWLLDQGRSGGAILDLLVHDVDQALFLFGMPARVSAKSLGDVDTVSATLIYPAGSNAALSAAPEVRIQGGWFPAGTPFAMGFQVIAERGSLELTPDGLWLTNGAGEKRKIDFENPDGYSRELKYFIDSCINNQPPVRCLPEDSARSVKLALAIRESRNAGGQQISCDEQNH